MTHKTKVVDSTGRVTGYLTRCAHPILKRVDDDHYTCETCGGKYEVSFELSIVVGETHGPYSGLRERREQ